MTQPTLIFNGTRATLSKRKYVDGSLCLQLFTEDMEPLATATVCLAEYGFTPPPGFACIKDYSENAGMLSALTEAGIVEPTGEVIPCGYVEAHLVRVLI